MLEAFQRGPVRPLPRTPPQLGSARRLSPLPRAGCMKLSASSPLNEILSRWPSRGLNPHAIAYRACQAVSTPALRCAWSDGVRSDAQCGVSFGSCSCHVRDTSGGKLVVNVAVDEQLRVHAVMKEKIRLLDACSDVFFSFRVLELAQIEKGLDGRGIASRGGSASAPQS